MSFKVTVEPSARSFEVDRDEAVLAAAIRQGIGLPYGCRDGACGSCKSRLLQGRVIHGAHQQKALSDAEEAAGLMLTCCATPQTDLAIENKQLASEGQFQVIRMPVRVLSIDKPAPDVAIVRLQLPASNPLRYHAGQYLEFILKDGSRRSYSMANAPHDLSRGVELHIRHMPGGVFTDHVFAGLKEKDILRAEGPMGSFYLREASAAPILLLASGTGLAPIKAMLEHMRERGITRPTALYWGCRSRADLYWHAPLQALLADMPNVRYVPVLSEPRPEDQWQGRLGFVHRAVMDDLPDLSAHEVYACGAPVMVNSAKADFVQHRGLHEENFYADSFTSEADRVPRPV